MFQQQKPIQHSLIGDRENKLVSGAMTYAPTENFPNLTCLVCGGLTIVCTTNALLQSCHFKLKKMQKVFCNAAYILANTSLNNLIIIGAVTKCSSSKSQIQRSVVGDRENKLVFGAITNAPT